MSTKSILHKAKLNEWASRFADQKASGLTVTEWCKQNNLSEYKYFYWKRLLKEEAVEQVLPDIVPLAMPSTPVDPTQVIPRTSELACESSASRASCASFTSSPCARLFINGICIEIDSSAPESFIKSIIKAVRYA